MGAALWFARSLPHSLVRRARIVLMSAEGVSNQTIAARCGVSVPTISHWRRCWRERGVAGLHGELRPGRPRSYGDEQVATLMKLTERYCVVYQTIKNGPKVSVSMQRM